MQKKIMSVVGARPNFMKIAPLARELKKHQHIRHILVHTGQHYDKALSQVFFDELGLAEPDRHLGVGSGRHGEMTGKIMIAFERVCQEMEPDLVMVVGDVNSTIAASLTARKLFIPVAHVEAGLRSFDETMPEELNRRLTDCLSNLLFVSEPSGMENLWREGMDMDRAHLVGDIMLETLQLFLPEINAKNMWERYGFEKGAYALATIHRPSNVDDPQALGEIFDILEVIPYPTILPIHPRTLGRLNEFGFMNRVHQLRNLKLVPPEPYHEFLSLMAGSALVFSDSGSVQSEASFFNIPCFICRENTERPIYMDEGTCELVGRDVKQVRRLCEIVKKGDYRTSTALIKELGTGVSAKIVEIMIGSLN